MGKQEVDVRRFQLGEGVEDRARVVLDVDGAQETEVEVAVALLAEQLDGLEHQGVAAASVGEAAVPVVGRAVAVEGDADLDAVLAEEVEIARAELKAVGVDPEIERRDAVEGGRQLFADAAQPCGAA